MTTEEGNKIIAEFMGCYKNTVYWGNIPTEVWGFKDTHITERWHESNFNNNTPYHSSWDWLMPVVEKIIEIDITPAPNWTGYRIDIVPRGYVKISAFPMPTIIRNVSIEGSLINAVYKSVTDFIQYYNEQQELKLKNKCTPKGA